MSVDVTLFVAIVRVFFAAITISFVAISLFVTVDRRCRRPNKATNASAEIFVFVQLI